MYDLKIDSFSPFPWWSNHISCILHSFNIISNFKIGNIFLPKSIQHGDIKFSWVDWRPICQEMSLELLFMFFLNFWKRVCIFAHSFQAWVAQFSHDMFYTSKGKNRTTKNKHPTSHSNFQFSGGFIFLLKIFMTKVVFLMMCGKFLFSC